MEEPYRGPPEIELRRTKDERNLHLLSVFHYVAAGLTVIFSSFFIIHVVLGIAMMRAKTSPQFPGILFAAFGSAGVLLGWTMAGLLAYAGRCLARRRRHTLCCVVAGVSCMFMPIGTALGVFALIALTNPRVRSLFDTGALSSLGPSPTFVPTFPVASAPPQQPPPAGWVSAEAKRRFSPRAALVLGAFLLAQLVVGVASAGYLIVTTLRRPMSFAYPESAQVVGDRIWYIERESGWGTSRDKAAAHLASIRAESDEPPERGPDVPGGSRFLAADGEAIWVLGGDAIARYEAGHVTTFPSARALRWPAPPFADHGRPSIFDWRGAREICMFQPRGDEWRVPPGACWKTSVLLSKLPNAWSVLPAGEGFDVFVQFGDDLRWRHIVMGGSLEDPSAWELVTSPAGRWTATSVGGDSWIVRMASRGVFTSEMQVLRRDGEWIVATTAEVPTFLSFAAIPLPSGGLRLVCAVAQGIETFDVRPEGGMRAARIHSRLLVEWTFDYRLVAIVMLSVYLLSLLAAAFLARLMRRYRTEDHGIRGVAPFASVLRRGLARGIDQCIAWGIAFPFWWPWWHAPTARAMAMAATSPRLLLGYAACLGAALLLGSWMEGRWGITPGKWLLRIRVVGTDGEPCGFGRALARNVIGIADGVLTFSVGMGFVAFTRDWQRLGDMAARTLVVRANPTPTT